jgi:hypothetical protein
MKIHLYLDGRRSRIFTENGIDITRELKPFSISVYATLNDLTVVSMECYPSEVLIEAPYEKYVRIKKLPGWLLFPGKTESRQFPKGVVLGDDFGRGI